jgi:hypothetical protein
MGHSIQPQIQFRQKLRIAIRFVVFGLGGLLPVIQTCTYLHPYLSPPLALAGACWAYLFVFFTIPGMVILLVAVLSYFPLAGSRWPWNLVDPALDWILLFALPLLGSYVLVSALLSKTGKQEDPALFNPYILVRRTAMKVVHSLLGLEILRAFCAPISADSALSPSLPANGKRKSRMGAKTFKALQWRSCRGHLMDLATLSTERNQGG